MSPDLVTGELVYTEYLWEVIGRSGPNIALKCAVGYGSIKPKDAILLNVERRNFYSAEDLAIVLLREQNE